LNQRACFDEKRAFCGTKYKLALQDTAVSGKTREAFFSLMSPTEDFPLSRRPIPRVLVLEGEGVPSEAGKRLRRLGGYASEAGHQVAFSPEPVLIEEAAPEVVLLDGNMSDVAGTIEEVRAHPATHEAWIIAVYGGKKEDVLTALRAETADEFLVADAPRFEVVARLQSGALIFRAREEAAHLREDLNRQTRVDDLTGVMSRRFFFQQAHRECSRARRYGHQLSCLMLEVNHFKLICSNVDEMAGEQVLRSTANIIGQWTRDSDLVARFADAKFAVLLPETGLDGATSVREKLQAALHEHEWKHGEAELPVSFSVGEAEFQPASPFATSASDEFIGEGDEAGEAALSTREALAGLLEDADAALYIARKSARVPEMFIAYTPASNGNAAGRDGATF